MPWVCVLIASSQSDSGLVGELRQLNHLAVVDVELEEAKDREPVDGLDLEKGRKVWRSQLISILKDSPSTERKFLRWKIVQSFVRADRRGRAYEVVVKEELEVFPDTSL